MAFCAVSMNLSQRCVCSPRSVSHVKRPTVDGGVREVAIIDPAGLVAEAARAEFEENEPSAMQRISQGDPQEIMEQAVEKDSPNTLDAKAAHQQGAEYARKVFAAFA